MSAVREKFEAEFRASQFGTADFESYDAQIPWLFWRAAWQERSEAPPSVSGLPKRPEFDYIWQNGAKWYCKQQVDPYMDAQSSRIVELEKELAETIEDVHAYVFAAKIQRVRADEAESKLDVCREETIKECAAAVSFACGAKEKLLSKLPTSVAEKKS